MSADRLRRPGAVVPGPQVAERTLGNGVHLVVSRLATTPLVHAHLAVPLDVAALGEGPAALAELAAVELLAAALVEHPAAHRLEERGGTVSVTRRRRLLVLTVSAHREDLDVVAATLGALLTRPWAGDPRPAALAACRTFSALVQSQPAAGSLATLWRRVYEEVPVALFPAAPPAAFAGAVPDPAAVRAARTGPRGAHVVVVGDLHEQAALDAFARTLSGWTDERDPAVAAPAAPVVRPAGHLDREAAGRSATHLRWAAPAPGPEDPAAPVAALVLGGNFSSRLNVAVREELGLAYRTAAFLHEHGDRSVLLVEADVTSARAVEAHERIVGLLARYAEHGPRPEELRAALAYTGGRYATTLASQSGRAACLLSYLTTGLGLDAVATLPQRLSALTVDDVRAVAARWHPDRSWSVAVGRTVHPHPHPHPYPQEVLA